jgi:hypothetical protein
LLSPTVRKRTISYGHETYTPWFRTMTGYYSYLTLCTATVHAEARPLAGRTWTHTTIENRS